MSTLAPISVIGPILSKIMAHMKHVPILLHFVWL